jgi:endonuclease/exonuclease/phosphatase (EEP) superfamily protein YafD
MRSAALVGPPAIGVVALALRHWRGYEVWQLGMVASAPYLMLLVPIGVIVALALRQWWMAVASTLVLTACIYTQAPLYIADSSPVTKTRFNVMTQNADLGRANAADIVRAARRHDVDALVVTELTPRMRERLRVAGVDKELPFAAVRTGRGGRGTGMWSRTRLTDARFIGGFTCAYVTARARIDWGDGPSPVRLVGLHLMGPTFDVEAWRRDAERLLDSLRPLSDATPTIVAGDFNETPDSPWLRDALRIGFTNAADGAGAGLVRTYPADRPVLAIDHVLTTKLVAQSVERVTVAGTDHLGIVATLALPIS